MDVLLITSIIYKKLMYKSSDFQNYSVKIILFASTSFPLTTRAFTYMPGSKEPTPMVMLLLPVDFTGMVFMTLPSMLRMERLAFWIPSGSLSFTHVLSLTEPVRVAYNRAGWETSLVFSQLFYLFYHHFA